LFPLTAGAPIRYQLLRLRLLTAARPASAAADGEGKDAVAAEGEEVVVEVAHGE
jgi:hypothetical protein